MTAVRGRDGIQSMDNGVLYTVNSPGEGTSPTPQSEVTIEYVGKFIDGEVFDQSPPGEPVTFPVRIFVEGFRTSILDMKPGESRTIYLPPHLAYGVLGAQGQQGEEGIPPNSALTFDVNARVVQRHAAGTGLPPGQLIPPARPRSSGPLSS